MDSEHRHELRENELAKFLMNLPDFIRKHWAAIIGWACIIAAILLWSPIRNWRAASEYKDMAEVTSLIRQVEGEKGTAAFAQDGQAAIMSVAQLEEAGRDADNDSLGALALIKSGDALRAEIHYTDMSRDAAMDQIAQAKSLYEDALDRAENNPVMTGMARFGIGLCAEEVGDYDQAKQLYNEIAADETLAVTVYPRLAKTRLQFMDDYKQEFTFEKAPEEEPAPTEEQTDEAAPAEEGDQPEQDQPAEQPQGDAQDQTENGDADQAQN